MSQHRLQIAKVLFLLAGTWVIRELWPAMVAVLGLSLVVSGWLVLLNKLFCVSFGEGYYRLRPWEQSLYNWVGVRWFKVLVNTGCYRALWGPSLRRRGETHSLERLAGEMRAAETAHASAFVLIALLTIPVAVSGPGAVAVWLFAGNALINLYPIMLQRRNRMRVELILRRRLAHAAREDRVEELWNAT